MVRVTIITALAPLLLGACVTTLESSPISEDKPRVGIPYVLPFTQFKVDVTWQVTECTPSDNARQVPSKIKLATKVVVADGVAEDEAQAYVMDPQRLQKLLAVTTFAVKYQDNSLMLASINATQEDRSSQVIANVVGGIGKLVVAAGTVGAAKAVESYACKDAVREAVTSMPDLEQTLENATKALQSEQKKLVAAQEVVAAMGSNVSTGAKDDLETALKAVKAALTAQAKATKALAEAVKASSATRTVYWPSASDVTTNATGPIIIPDDVIDKWSSLDELNQRPALIRDSAVYLTLAPLSAFGRTAATSTDNVTAETKNADGVRYRLPAKGRLFACATTPCGENTADVYAEWTGPVAQLGYVNILPFRSRNFATNAFSAEFTPLGALKAAGYDQKSAPAEGMSSAFKSTTDALADVITMEKGQAAAKRKAELDELDYLQKKKEALQKMRDDPLSDTSAATASIQADTTLLNAQIARINAQIALAEAVAKQAK